MEIIIGAGKVYDLFIFCISLIFRNKTLLFLRECCFVLRSYDIYYSQITGSETFKRSKQVKETKHMGKYGAAKHDPFIDSKSFQCPHCGSPLDRAFNTRCPFCGKSTVSGSSSGRPLYKSILFWILLIFVCSVIVITIVETKKHEERKVAASKPAVTATVTPIPASSMDSAQK